MRVLVLGQWRPYFRLIEFLYSETFLDTHGALNWSKKKKSFTHVLLLKGILYRPRLREFGVEAVKVPTLINLTNFEQTSWPKWSPESHLYHRPKVRQRIYQVLLGSKDPNSPLSRLDRHCLLILLSFVH